MHEVPVRMPKMSMTMSEGEVVTWLVQPGAEVQAGDTVCEVLTDKVDMEVEAPVSGRLVRIDVESGIAEVGVPIAWVETDEEDPLAGLFDDEDPSPGAAAGPATSAQAPAAAAEPAAAQAPAVEAPVAAAALADRSASAQTIVPPPSTTLTAAQGGFPSYGAPTAYRGAPSGNGTHGTHGTASNGSSRNGFAPAGNGSARSQGAGPAGRPGPVPAVPRARALARDNGIDLTSVAGSGPDGLIRVEDVEALVRPVAAPADAVGAPSAPVRAATPTSDGGRARRTELIRAATARTMTASAAVPQFTVWRDLDLESADPVRGRVSWTTVLLRAYASALREVPALLHTWDGSRAVGPQDVGIGLAVDTPDGLLVPVFADPDLVPVEDLDADVRATVSNARGGRIVADHLLPAVGTLSNLGGLGVDRFQALVTPPQASVLAAGSVDRRPVAVPGGIGLGLRLTVGLSVDHRVADGAHGATLLGALATALADPLRLLGPVRAQARQ